MLREDSSRDSVPRVWLQDVEADVIALRGELADVGADPRSAGTVASVECLLDNAFRAARGEPPHHRRRSRWSGECVEAAYRSVHRAEAEIAKLYDDAGVVAAIPEAVARLQAALPASDRRCEAVADLVRAPRREKALKLSRVIQVGHEVKDQQYAKVRRFRNIVVIATVLVTAFLAGFAALISVRPVLLPLCFDSSPPSAPHTGQAFCPAGRGIAPGSFDVWIVLLMGAVGGTLAAALSIRNIRGNPTPYNLANALAILKVPTGALTAVGGLVLIAGQAVPGLSDLDTQGQVLAYALVFGYAQQIFTKLIDKRAGQLVDDIPTKVPERADDRPGRPVSPGPAPVPRKTLWTVVRDAAGSGRSALAGRPRPGPPLPPGGDGSGDGVVSGGRSG